MSLVPSMSSYGYPHSLCLLPQPQSQFSKEKCSPCLSSHLCQAMDIHTVCASCLNHNHSSVKKNVARVSRPIYVKLWISTQSVPLASTTIIFSKEKCSPCLSSHLCQAMDIHTVCASCLNHNHSSVKKNVAHVSRSL